MNKYLIGLIGIAFAVSACAPSQPGTTTTEPETTTTAPVTTTTTQASPWRQVFFEDFDTPVPEGQFPGTVYSAKFGVYPNNSPDTSANIEGSASRYFPSDVLSVSDGTLRKRLHVDDGVPKVATVTPLLPGTPAYNPSIGGGWPQINDTPTAMLYGRYTLRWRSTSAAGFKVAWLLWPETEMWPRDGEIDFPEGDLNSNICAFMHRQNATSGSDQDATCTNTAVAGQWHTTTIERGPGYISFILNGVEIMRSTQRLPDKRMTWRIQTETCFTRCQPVVGTEALIEIDWVRVESYFEGV